VEVTAYRSVELQYARSAHLLDGKGSMKHGSRWNAPGAFKTVSLCLEALGADQEALRRASYYGWTAEALRPRVRVAVTARLQKVLRMKQKGTPALKQVVVNELLDEDWRKINDSGKESLSQALAWAAREQGAEGLLVPSATVDSAFNLIVFVDKLLPGSQMKIENQEELDRWLKKR
jgi:RES domain-containing protein